MYFTEDNSENKKLKLRNHQELTKTNQNVINGDLVYKFKKIIGKNDFSFQFRKFITRYRRIGYNFYVMRQSACLVFNPIMVDNYAAFFNCTPVGRASDDGPDIKLFILVGWGRSFLPVAWPTGFQLVFFFCSGFQ